MSDIISVVVLLVCLIVAVPAVLYFATLKIRVFLRLNRVLRLIEDWFYNQNQ